MKIVRNVLLLILSALYGSSIYSMEHTAIEMDILGAIKADDIASVKKFITANPTIIDQQDDTGRTALQLAAEKGHIGTIRALLVAGAKIDLKARWLKHKPDVSALL